MIAATLGGAGFFLAKGLFAGRPVVPCDREAVFWFLLMSPMLVLLGRVVRHGIAAIGLVVMPLCGFWAVLVLGFLVRRRAAGFVDSPALVAVGGRLREAS
ncbi:MAG: hypothetical protein P8R42_02625 [Candidatus Binatia bacterium]|nr:hypothetical protein [Candidatus Binatia bacterium]